MARAYEKVSAGFQNAINGFVMGFKSRKLYVWLISVVAVLAIYLLYNQISKTPPIEIDTGAKFTDSAAESNMGEFDSEIGMVGDVGVGTVQKAKYTHLNAEKQVDREFGFEKLLHMEGDEWEIEKPYMNIFRHNLKCYLTADKGKVQVEDAAGRATPKDATLTGNVVIHILPENDSNIKESFIYLDDVIFISEKSQFSTAGPVKFTSKDAQMLGRGMELVYNESKDRLEFFKIIDLETLRLKQSSKASLFSSEETDFESPASTDSRTQTPSAQVGAVHDLPQPDTAKDRQKATEIPTVSRGAIEKKKGEYYRCVFSKNVIIDSPEQLIFCDEISINNILFAKTSDRKYENRDNGSTDKMKTAVDPVRNPLLETQGEKALTGDPKERVSNGVEITKESVINPRSEPNELSSERFVDIVVTCDNGIVVVPMDSPRMPQNAATTDNKGHQNFNNSSGRPTFVAQRIDHCVVTKDTVASGPSELTFYVNDVIGSEGKQTAVPVKVTAQKKASFLPALNQVIFEGNTLCTMVRAESKIQKTYTLSAPKLTVNLSKDRDKQFTSSAAGIEHLTTSGGGVRLATVETAGSKLVGGIELKCVKFDYDTSQQLFLATGPAGIIKVDNSAEPQASQDRKFSLQKQCYAIVRNFDTLKYYLETNQIIADAGGEGIFLDYFPTVDGKYEQQVAVTASHIEALLYETAGGQTELSKLSATGGITYEEKKDKKKKGKKTIQFVGSKMFYDADTSIITVRGDESQPCLFNGALVDGIKYDLETDKIKTKITGPGMLQMRR